MTVKVVTTTPRRGGSPVQMDGREFLFVRDEQGLFVCEMEEADAARFLKIGDIYYRYGDPLPTPDPSVRVVTDRGPPMNETGGIKQAEAELAKNKYLGYSDVEVATMYEARTGKKAGNLSTRAMANQLLKLDKAGG